MSDLNLKSSTIEKGLDLIKGFLKKAIGPSVEELGLTWSDSMRQRRAMNQLKAFQKMKQIAERDQVNIKQINLKALYPLLEGIALEEDNTIQDMWANLFVNYIDSSKNLTLNVFPDILKQLSSNEVIVLTVLDRNRAIQPTLRRDLTCSDEELSNIVRLGLIDEEIDTKIDQAKKIEYGSAYLNAEYYLTDFGISFFIACSREQPA